MLCCAKNRRRESFLVTSPQNPGLTNIIVIMSAFSRMCRGKTDKSQFCNVYDVVVCFANENGKVQKCV